MKITGQYTIHPPLRKVEVSLDDDDLDIYDVLEDLVIPCLVGLGFFYESIMDGFATVLDEYASSMKEKNKKKSVVHKE